MPTETLLARSTPPQAAPGPSPEPGTSSGLDALSSVLEAVGDLPTSRDRDAAFARILEQLREVVPWHTAAVLYLDDAGSELTFRWSQGLPDSVTERWRFGLGQGLVGRVAEQALTDVESAGGRSFALDDECDLDRQECPPLPGLRSEMAVPLVGHEQVLGVLDLGSRDSDAFTAEHLQFVRLVGRHLGRNIERSCAHDRARRLAENLSFLQQAGHDLTSILDRKLLLERISDVLGRLLEYQIFSVMVWNEEAQHLEPLFSRRQQDDIPGVGVLKLGEGLCGSAAALRQPVRVGNVQSDSRYFQCADERVRSEMVVPLVIEDRLLGVVDLASFEYDAFTEEHEQLLQTLASSIAVALENANLYERLRRDEQRLARDLTTAREVQHYLLPRRSPWVPGLQVGVANVPAQHLGGDIYDFYSYGEGRTAFAIGDVAGKGTGAALYGSLTVGLLRGGYAGDSQCDPPCVMAYLNDELRQLDVDRRFLAMGFAVYRSADRRLELSNAGLPYPWLIRDGRARELELGGLPLGATQHRERGSLVLELQPGDVVVFTTDGIDECSVPGGEPFGSERVRELLEHETSRTRTWIAQDLADALVHATDEYLEGMQANDDRTVLVLKVTG